jgi:hypothetical protein
VAPSANTAIEIRKTLIPTPRAISGSSTVARIIAPMRVRSSVSQSVSATTTATTTMKMRYTGK